MICIFIYFFRLKTVRFYYLKHEQFIIEEKYLSEMLRVAKSEYFLDEHIGKYLLEAKIISKTPHPQEEWE